MRNLLPLVLAAACTPTPPAAAAPEATAPADTKVEDVAVRLGSAWAACDRPTALALSLSYEDLVALTRKEVDRAEFERDTRDFLEQRCRELAEAGAKVVGAQVTKMEHHARADDPERLKQDVDAAFVQLVFEHDGERAARGVPLLFLRTPHGYRFSMKH
jgi:hypothetical protein